MAALPEARSDKVAFSGGMNLYVHSGAEITLTTTTVTQGDTLVPWNSTLTKLWLNIRTAATLTTVNMYVGKRGTVSAYVNAYNLDLSTAGLYEISLATSASHYVSSSVTAGSVVIFTFTTGATAILSAGVMIEPWQ